MATRKEVEKQKARRTNAKAWADKMSKGDATDVQFPEGFKQYKIEEGTHEIDIMPFLAGSNNPNADKGFEHFEAMFRVHRIPRPDGNFDRLVCLWHRWRDSCPCCNRQRDANCSKEEIDALRAQQRHLFLVNDKPGDKKNPLKILNAVYYNRKLGFGEQLKLAVDDTRGGENLANLQGGFTVRYNCEDVKYGSISRISLQTRDYEYPESMLENAPCLDEMIIKPKASDMAELLGQNGTKEDDTDFPEKPLSGGKKAKEEESEAEEEESEPDDEMTAEELGIEKGCTVRYKGKDCEVVKISSDGTSLTLEDPKGKTIAGVGPGEVKLIEAEDAEDSDEDEPEDEDDTPKRPSKKPAVDDDDDEEASEDDSEVEEPSDTEDEDDDKPRGRPKKK